jgi:hypothetical protein
LSGCETDTAREMGLWWWWSSSWRSSSWS